jgi:hypothetical protein
MGAQKPGFLTKRRVVSIPVVSESILPEIRTLREPIGVNLSLKALINVVFTLVQIPLASPLRRGTLIGLLSPPS